MEAAAPVAKAVTWRWTEPRSIGGEATQVLGKVDVADDAGSGGHVLRFNGTDTGLLLAEIPHAGWKTFTIEMRIRPAKGGPEEQRFLHFEDPAGQRGLIELRLTPEGRWSLDTFLRTSDAARLTLHDPKINHPADQWSWVAMVYDGAQMRSYVDGVKELEGLVAFGPLGAGKTSVGVRQTLKSWFLGDIAEVRFHPRALKAEELAKER